MSFIAKNESGWHRWFHWIGATSPARTPPERIVHAQCATIHRSPEEPAIGGTGWSK
jgi:hypothetical protein